MFKKHLYGCGRSDFHANVTKTQRKLRVFNFIVNVIWVRRSYVATFYYGRLFNYINYQTINVK